MKRKNLLSFLLKKTPVSTSDVGNTIIINIIIINSAGNNFDIIHTSFLIYILYYNGFQLGDSSNVPVLYRMGWLL